jgi:dihydrofolate synthase/folylpolyglutamate synthase
MDGREAIEWIHSTCKLGSKLGLENVTELSRRMGDPHRRFRSVHVAGTNGKGSVCAMLYTTLRAAGYRTGLFTSPYLVDFRERIQADGTLIPYEDLARIASRVKDAVGGMLSDGWNHPTEYEIVTVIGFTYFAELGLDVAVIEVGLGGRLDMTNIITPELSVITPISLDHTQILGDTVDQVAYEKAGIIKPGIPVVSAPQEPEAAQVLRDAARERGAAIAFAEREDVRIQKADLIGQTLDFRVDGQWETGYAIPLVGPHQAQNALTARLAVDLLRRQGYVIPEDALREGFSRAYWPGRVEVAEHSPLVILDGTHNPAGAIALRDAVSPHLKGKRVVLVMGMMADKDVSQVAAILAPLSACAIATRVDNPRAMDTGSLSNILGTHIPTQSVEDPMKALDLAKEMAGKGGAVLVTGSLYLIGAVKECLGQTAVVP